MLDFCLHASGIELIGPNQDKICRPLSWYFTFTVCHGKKLLESDSRSIIFKILLAIKKIVEKRLALWRYKQVVP